MQALRSIAVVIISVIIGKSAFLFERGKKTQTQGVLTSFCYDDASYLLFTLILISQTIIKSSSDTDEPPGSEVAFAVVVVIVMLQALFTISVHVASKKNACSLSSLFFFNINYVIDDDIKIGKHKLYYCSALRRVK